MARLDERVEASSEERGARLERHAEVDAPDPLRGRGLD